MIRLYLIGSLITALALCAVIGWRYHSIVVAKMENTAATLTLERDAARSDLRQARANEQALETQLKQANAAIEELAAKSAAAEAAAQLDVARVRMENQALYTRVQKLLTATRPPGMTACQNAERLINEEIAAIASTASAGRVRQ